MKNYLQIRGANPNRLVFQLTLLKFESRKHSLKGYVVTPCLRVKKVLVGLAAK